MGASTARARVARTRDRGRGRGARQGARAAPLVPLRTAAIADTSPSRSSSLDPRRRCHCGSQWYRCESHLDHATTIPDLAHDEHGMCTGSNNLWWGNYAFHSDPGRFGGLGATPARRGLVLSRYGGLGTHRYPVGFSGDAQQSYLTLQFQIEMTPKASNVLFGLCERKKKLLFEPFI
jgi:hypothetical protein